MDQTDGVQMKSDAGRAGIFGTGADRKVSSLNVKVVRYELQCQVVDAIDGWPQKRRQQF